MTEEERAALQKEADRRRLARMELARDVSQSVTKALECGLEAEAGVLSLLINAMMTGTSGDLLAKLYM